MSFSSPQTRSSTCWCRSSPLVLGLLGQIRQWETQWVWPTVTLPSSAYGCPARNGGLVQHTPLVLLLVEEAVSNMCPFSSSHSETWVHCWNSQSSACWLLIFLCMRQAIFLKDCSTSSDEMEMPFPFRTTEFIIELSIRIQISCQSHVKYTVYAFRTEWTLHGEVVSKYWLQFWSGNEQSTVSALPWAFVNRDSSFSQYSATNWSCFHLHRNINHVKSCLLSVLLSLHL